MKVAVGCPIRNRAWIFPDWLEHVRAAFEVAGVKPYWTFVIGLDANGKDDGTQKMVTDLYKEENGIWSERNEAPPEVRNHPWNGNSYHHMVECRNQLLSIVRATQPDYFLSLDSDILLHPSALTTLLETIQTSRKIEGADTKFDAVGGKTYLSIGSRHITTYAFHNPNGGLTRQDSEGVFPVEVIMAIKLMGPTAYQIPYIYSRSGEDIGWSDNCREHGLTLGWDGRVCSKHIMDPEFLTKIDRRVGW